VDIYESHRSPARMELLEPPCWFSRNIPNAADLNTIEIILGTKEKKFMAIEYQAPNK
jgi:hypothetical protein